MGGLENGKKTITRARRARNGGLFSYQWLHERGSFVLTSNKHVREWPEILDRLLQGRPPRALWSMGTSVRTFSRAHPSADASYKLVIDRPDATIARIEGLAKQQEGDYASKHSSVVRRQDLRRRLHQRPIRHLVTTAEHAGTEIAGIAAKFRLPSTSGTHAAFRAVASELLEVGRANQDVLVKYGRSATLLDEQSQVAARAEMKALGDEVVRIAGILDGFNRYRFHTDPELIAAWESAKHRVSGPQAKEGSGAPVVPVPSGFEPVGQRGASSASRKKQRQ